MFRIAKVVAAIVLAAVTASAGVGVAQAASPQTHSGTAEPLNVLRSGESLSTAVGGRSFMQSPSGEFQLVIEDSIEGFGINQHAAVPSDAYFSSPTWLIGFPGVQDHPSLKLQTDGNLVLYNLKGKALWNSHTAGSGAGSVLYLQDDGNLVLRSATGKVSWAAGSSRVILRQGQALAPGRYLEYMYPDMSHTYRLTMWSDGDLVYAESGYVLWSSNTHVRGSSLVMQSDGNLVVRTPSGRPVWSSKTFGYGPNTWFQVDAFQLEIDHFTLQGETTKFLF